MRRIILALIIGFMTLSGSQVMAVDFPNGFYAGASGGISDDRDFCAQTGNFSSCDERDFTWKIYGGYQFLKWISLEGGYVDLGGAETDTPGASKGDFVISDVDGLLLAAPFTAPFLEKAGIYGKIGAFFWCMVFPEPARLR